jgi:hypothetical protein
MGIEPTSEAWEASILPLYDARSSLAVDYTQLRDFQYRQPLLLGPDLRTPAKQIAATSGLLSDLNDRLYMQRRDSSFGLLKVGQHP